MAHPVDPPIPAVELPPGRAVMLPGRGDTFYRDTGGDGPPVLLSHGWMFSADTNWWHTFGALSAAGYRAIGLDHRGHGRGLRTPAPFRLLECAHDAAALLRVLETGPVTVVGYSMGGPIASLLTREHRDLVSGLVLCATAAHWQEPAMRRGWKAMAAVRLLMGAAPISFWNLILRGSQAKGSARSWVASELGRGNARDIAEAGRELGRYDSRAWLPGLGVPAACVITAKDTLVPPHLQRDQATLLGAPAFDVPADHMAAGLNPDAFHDALLPAVAAVTGAERPPVHV